MIKRLRRARDASLKDIVNDALRRGLNDLTTAPGTASCSRRTKSLLGRLHLVSIDNISESLAIAEGEAFK